MPNAVHRRPADPTVEPRAEPRTERLVLPVEVDGRRVRVEVCGSALQGRFGATDDPRSWLAAYRAHAGRVNHAAIRKTRSGATEPILLTDTDFG